MAKKAYFWAIKGENGQLATVEIPCYPRKALVISIHPRKKDAEAALASIRDAGNTDPFEVIKVSIMPYGDGII